MKAIEAYQVSDGRVFLSEREYQAPVEGGTGGTGGP